MLTSSSLLSVALFATAVLSHGQIVTPPVRADGPAMKAACGASVTALFTSDPSSHIEDMPEAAALEKNFDPAACNLFLCRGTQFADNTANVQTYQAGQVVNFQATLPIPHKGPMNVSIIDTATNTAIGAPLIAFTSYADESLATLPANNTDFDVTIPSTLGDKCTVAGACVMQWFWFGTSAVQTYENCVDMVVPAAGGAAPVAAAAAAVPKAAAAKAPRPRVQRVQ